MNELRKKIEELRDISQKVFDEGSNVIGGAKTAMAFKLEVYEQVLNLIDAQPPIQSELVEKLQELSDWFSERSFPSANDDSQVIRQAADTIQSQSEELERLSKALEQCCHVNLMVFKKANGSNIPDRVGSNRGRGENEASAVPELAAYLRDRAEGE